MPDDQRSAYVDQELATKIVAAYVRRNQLGADQLGSLIATVYQALAGLGKSLEAVIMERTPAVPIRRSVHRNYVVCLDCGWRGQMLRRHVASAHGLSVDEYRARWNLPRNHAMTAPGYSERRSTMAKQFGLGQRRKGMRKTAPSRQPASTRRGRPRSSATSIAPA